MFEPFKRNPKQIIFSTSNYTVPAGHYAEVIPMGISSQSLGNIAAPTPANYQIDSNVVFRGSFSTLGAATVTTPSGSWSISFGADNIPSVSDTINLSIGGQRLCGIGERAIVFGSNTVIRGLGTSKRIGFVSLDTKIKKTFAPQGSLLSGTSPFRWFIVLYEEYS